jgi:elongation factor Ts
MAEITAKLVSTLREKTNAGMMECKAALKEADGDLDKAETILRKKGITKAEKKADRQTKEGVVASQISGGTGVLAEVNCETDFVAKNENFKAFVAELCGKLAGGLAADSSEIVELIKGKIAEMGENIVLRRLEVFQAGSGQLQSYIHLGGRVGVPVSAEGAASPEAATTLRDVCMHIAASSPKFIQRQDVPQSLIDREREIAAEQVKGKPAEIVDKIVNGKIEKIFAEQCLVGQAFIKNPDQSVGDLLKAANLSVTRFVRYAVGEEI